MEEQLNKIEYYANGILFIVAVFVTIIGIFNFKKIGFYSIFLILTSASFLQNLIVHKIHVSFNTVDGSKYYNYVLNLYLILELIVLSIFFIKKIESFIIKKFLRFFTTLFIFFLLFIYLIKNSLITLYFSQTTAFISIFLLINCIILFVQILTDELNVNLLKSPDFLITSGIFFLFSFTSPFYMIYDYVQNKNDILHSCFYIVNYIGYLFFFTSIIIAFKCKIHLIKS